MVCGQALANGTNNGNAVIGGAASPTASNPAEMGAEMQGTENMQEEAVSKNATEPPDNDLMHFSIDIEQGYGNQVYRSSIFTIFFISEYKCSRILIKDQ